MQRIDPVIGSRHSFDSSSTNKTVLYAVGDVYGCAKELSILRRRIVSERTSDKDLTTKYRIIYLGNYVGSGLQSADVIDLFISTPLKDIQETFLLGQNDWAFTNFVFGRSYSAKWLRDNGGLDILKSYGVPTQEFHPLDFSGLRECLLKKMPPDHITFLKSLILSDTYEDYFFAHAGISPERSLDKQTPSDLISPNDRFLTSKKRFDKIIVHGHYEMLMPGECHNRISLNTACHKTGVLTCLRLQNKQRHFLQASIENT